MGAAMTIELNHVLVVDDEPDTLAVIQMSFEVGGGAVVDTACDGREALAKAAQRAYDVILLDVVMPGLSGVEVLRALGSVRPETPVIMVTQHATPEAISEYLCNGAVGVIAKPFDVPTLYQRVMQLLDDH
jgi:two-component system, OmpR family, response regulator